MTIDEAIKRLTNKANESWSKDELKDADACQLGIEALKRHMRNTASHEPGLITPLPGETKAVDQRTANIGYGSSEALKKQRR